MAVRRAVGTVKESPTDSGCLEGRSLPESSSEHKGKKRFAGHNVAGYACQPNFSPDGQYVISGDSGGRVYIWDWKTCRILKMLKAHDRVAIDVEWHPLEPSKMASASWDGSIKYWD